jgi:ribosome-associated translation inhibitor RaiA
MKKIQKIDGLSKYGNIINSHLVEISDAIKKYGNAKVQEKVNPLERVILGEMILAILEEYLDKVYNTDLRINFNLLQLEFGENPQIEKDYNLYKVYLN